MNSSKDNTFTSEVTLLKSKLNDGIAFSDFNTLFEGTSTLAMFERTSNFGSYLLIVKKMDSLGFEIAIHVLAIYPGESIKKSPDYKGQLLTFMKKYSDRVVFKTFLSEEGRTYYRIYLRKTKGM